MRALCLLILIALSLPAVTQAKEPQHAARHIARHKHIIRYEWHGKGDTVRLVPVERARPVYLNTRTYSPYGYTPIPSTDYYVPPPVYLPRESDPDVSGPEPRVPF